MIVVGFEIDTSTTTCCLSTRAWTFFTLAIGTAGTSGTIGIAFTSAVAWSAFSTLTHDTWFATIATATAVVHIRAGIDTSATTCFFAARAWGPFALAIGTDGTRRTIGVTFAATDRDAFSGLVAPLTVSTNIFTFIDLTVTVVVFSVADLWTISTSAD